ncbi:MAG: hypothetical protein OEY79_00750 [Anaplasmataceae bacterium]|nr:hypothetical protein [Anaplasmataceae bacterium]
MNENIEIFDINDQYLPIKIDESALKEIHKIQARNEEKILCIIIKGGGCSAYSYEFLIDKLENIVKEDDGNNNTNDDYEEIIMVKKNQWILITHEKSPIVIIDSLHIKYIVNSTLEYQNSLIKKGFKISNNPQSSSGCGCGKSFNLK